MERISSGRSSTTRLQQNGEGNSDEDFDFDFDEASLSHLSQVTEIDEAQWCRWFKGVGTSETSLKKAAGSLCVSPGTLLDRIIRRRESPE